MGGDRLIGLTWCLTPDVHQRLTFCCGDTDYSYLLALLTWLMPLKAKKNSKTPENKKKLENPRKQEKTRNPHKTTKTIENPCSCFTLLLCFS